MLKLDPTHSPAWCCVGRGIEHRDVVTACGTEYTQQECYIQALKFNPRYSLAWLDLGDKMNANDTATVNGTQHSKTQCFLQPLKYDTGPRKASGQHSSILWKPMRLLRLMWMTVRPRGLGMMLAAKFGALPKE